MHRPEWWPRHGNIVEMAQDLHEYTTGACEINDPQHMDMCIRCLHYAVKHWKLPETDYDKIVKMLCTQALHDYDEYMKGITNGRCRF